MVYLLDELHGELLLPDVVVALDYDAEEAPGLQVAEH